LIAHHCEPDVENDSNTVCVDSDSNTISVGLPLSDDDIKIIISLGPSPSVPV